MNCVQNAPLLVWRRAGLGSARENQWFVLDRHHEKWSNSLDAAARRSSNAVARAPTGGRAPAAVQQRRPPPGSVRGGACFKYVCAAR